LEASRAKAVVKNRELLNGSVDGKRLKGDSAGFARKEDLTMMNSDD
jgi:hypothetical protein